MGEGEGRAMDHLGIPLDVALALRLVRAQPRRGRGALPHRAAPHGCRNQRREPRDLPNQAAILRPRVYVCLSFGAPLTPLPLRVYTRATPGYALPRQRSNAAIATPQGPARQPRSLHSGLHTKDTEAHSGSPHSHTKHSHTRATYGAARTRYPTAEGTPWVAHEGLQPLDPLCEELLHSATRYEAAPARRRCSSSQALDPRLPRGTREPFGSETLHH